MLHKELLLAFILLGSDQTTTNVVEIDDEEEADDETVDETYEDFEESEEKFGINNEVKGPSTSGNYC